MFTGYSVNGAGLLPSLLKTPDLPHLLDRLRDFGSNAVAGEQSGRDELVVAVAGGVAGEARKRSGGEEATRQECEARAGALHGHGAGGESGENWAQRQQEPDRRDCC